MDCGMLVCRMSRVDSKFFSDSEIFGSATADRLGIDNTAASEEQLEHLRFTAAQMDIIREYLGFPVLVHSWFRCVDLNAAVGGKPTSRHALGLAVDFSCPKFGSVEEVWNFLKKEPAVLGWRKLILEKNSKGSEWIHVSFPADGELFAPRAFRLYPD